MLLRPHSLAAVLASTLSFGAAFHVDAQVTTYFRGNVQTITVNPNGCPILRVNGVNFEVDSATTVYTPTTNLLKSQLLDTAVFVGTTNAGFRASVAVIEANPSTNSTSLVAKTVFLVPNEHEVLGRVTANAGGVISIEGVPIRLLVDPRLPAVPVVHETGAPADLLANPPAIGSYASARGYYDTRLFRAYELTVSSRPATTNVVAPPSLTVSFACANFDCTTSYSSSSSSSSGSGGRIELRGSVSLRHAPPEVKTQRIAVYRVDNGIESPLGTLTATRSRTSDVGVFSSRLDLPASTDPVLRLAPTVLKLVNLDSYPVSAAATVNVTVCK
jgi:hypothetical protein